MKIGRPRQLNPLIPAHIDQAKIPSDVYFDARDGGAWYALYRDANGKRRRKNLANAKATVALLHRRLEEVRAGDDRGTLAALMREFAESAQFAALGASTRTDYAYCRDAVTAHKDKAGGSFAAWPLDAITSPVMQVLVDTIGRTHPSKANHVLRYLRRLFRWGGNRGKCAKTNPAAGIECAHERRHRQLPSPDAMVAAIRYAEACGARPTRTRGSQPPYLWAVAELAYLCRLRGIEVCTLTDANASTDGVLTNRRKGSRDNVVTWSPRLRAAWNALVARRDGIWEKRGIATPLRAEDRPLVVDESGAALGRGVLKTAWRRLMVAAVGDGVLTAEQRFGMHAFKRRGITDTSGTRAEKQEASGHKSAAMVAIYDFSVPRVKPAGE